MNSANVQNSQIYNKFKNLFMIFFMTMLAARFVSLYWVLPRIIDTAAFLLISGVGLSLFAVGFASRKVTFKSSRLWLLVLFFVSCVISCVLFVKYGWANNFKALLSIALSVFFLYSNAFCTDKIEFQKTVILLQKTLIVIWLVLALISLGTFFVQYSSIFYVRGTRVLLGCIENRLFGMFSDPNYASVVSILTIIFSFAILNYENQSKLIRRICVLNIAVQFFYIVLGASRTGEVCLLFVTAISFFVFSYRLNDSKKWWAVLARIFAALVFCVLVHFVIEYLRLGFSYIPSLFEPFWNKEAKGAFVFHQVSMERPDVAESSDISNLRFRIWSSAAEIFKTTWFFGASPRNALLYAQEALPDSFVVKRGYDAHNFYVATMLYTGVSGIILLGGFLFTSAFKILRHYIKKSFIQNDALFNSMAISVVCIAVSGMFLSEILFITTLGSFFFWLFLGSVMKEIDSKVLNIKER